MQVEPKFLAVRASLSLKLKIRSQISTLLEVVALSWFVLSANQSLTDCVLSTLYLQKTLTTNPLRDIVFAQMVSNKCLAVLIVSRIEPRTFSYSMENPRFGVLDAGEWRMLVNALLRLPSFKGSQIVCNSTLTSYKCNVIVNTRNWPWDRLQTTLWGFLNIVDRA